MYAKSKCLYVYKQLGPPLAQQAMTFDPNLTKKTEIEFKLKKPITISSPFHYKRAKQILFLKRRYPLRIID